MSRAFLRHQLSVWLLAVLLLAWAVLSASATSSALFYAPSQRAHTLAFLQGFRETIPVLQWRWRGWDFCRWSGITCQYDGVVVEAAMWRWFGYGGGSLPELPPGVDGDQVLVTRISFACNSAVLSGTLPASWGRLTQLSILDLRSNSLMGSLPDSWGGMASLTYLNLYANTLVGTLPAGIAQMSNLAVLNLGSNIIYGNLPAAWGHMWRLTTLRLDRNYLSGPIPASWGGMFWLRRVSLNDNYLCGCQPPEWQWRGVSVTADFGTFLPFCTSWDRWCWANGATTSPAPSVSPPPPVPSASASLEVPTSTTSTTSTPSKPIWPSAPPTDGNSGASAHVSFHEASSGSAASAASAIHSEQDTPLPTSTSPGSSPTVAPPANSDASSAFISQEGSSSISSISSISSSKADEAGAGSNGSTAGETLSTASSSAFSSFSSSSSLSVPSAGISSSSSEVVGVESSSKAIAGSGDAPLLTDVQTAATRALLFALRDAFVKLAPLWEGTGYCTWFGVSCDASGYVQVDLANMDLVGVMPVVPKAANEADIMITSVILRDNKGITGRLDISWFLIPSLQVLDVNGCGLADALPQANAE